MASLGGWGAVPSFCAVFVSLILLTSSPPAVSFLGKCHELKGISPNHKQSSSSLRTFTSFPTLYGGKQ